MSVYGKGRLAIQKGPTLFSDSTMSLTMARKATWCWMPLGRDR